MPIRPPYPRPRPAVRPRQRSVSHCLSALCPQDKGEQWTIAPYCWAPRLYGNAQLDGQQADFDYSAKELIGGLNLGGMGFLHWSRGRDFFYLEGLAFRYEDRLDAFQNKRLSAQLAMVEVGDGCHYCLGWTAI